MALKRYLWFTDLALATLLRLVTSKFPFLFLYSLPLQFGVSISSHGLWDTKLALTTLVTLDDLILF